MAINFNQTTNNITADSGSVSINGVVPSSGGATKTIVNTAVAYNVTATDLGKIINCTSGTFNVYLSAAASLGSGFTCTIWNTSNTASNVITIDPAGTETIDGKTTLTLQRGEGLAIVCDGTNWQTDDKKPMRVYAENINSSSSEARPVASADGAVAIGLGASSSGGAAISLGYSANATSFAATAIGANSGGTGSQAVTGAGAMALGGSYASGTDSFAAAIANNTSSYGATGANGVAIGQTAKAGPTSIAIGSGADASYNNSVSIGLNATTNSGSSYRALAVGYSCSANGNYSTSIGANSGGTGSQAVTGAGAMALGGSYASGADSFAAAIGNNTSSYGATTDYSVVLGNACKSSGSGSFVAGQSALSSAIRSVAIGFLPTASGTYSTALGAYALAAQIGKFAFGTPSTGVSGQAQAGKIVLYAATTTTTAVVLTSDGGAASTTNQLIVASGQAMAIQGTLIAKVTASGAMAGWNITGIVSNNAGTMAVSGLALTAIGTDSITLGAQPTIAVDNTNKGVTITSGYKAATSIRWCATVNTSEVTY